MDAERVRRELWRQLNPINESTLGNAFLASVEGMTGFVNRSAEAIAKMADESKPEPPEPPKTVLPDVSGLACDTNHWFFAEDGRHVLYRRSLLEATGRWLLEGDVWQYAGNFVAKYPHLGRLRRAVPGEVAE